MTNFQTTLGIIALDEADKPLVQMMFTQAFPTSLDGINFDYKKPDLIEVGASFAFSQYRLQILK